MVHIAPDVCPFATFLRTYKIIFKEHV
jgi:hypothetical protein